MIAIITLYDCNRQTSHLQSSNVTFGLITFDVSHHTFGRPFPLLGKHVEFGSRSEVRAVLARQSREAKITGFLWFGKQDLLFLRRVLKVAFHNGLSPILSVSTQLHSITLDVSVRSTILARQIGEALYQFHLATIEIYPVWIFRHSYAVHRVPNGARIAVYKVLSYSLPGPSSLLT